MNTKKSKIEANPALIETINELCTTNREITLISLSTTDGFNIKSLADKSLQVEADKLAAMASSLCALSNSSSMQLTKKDFNITTIESDGGNILFMDAKYLDTSCVVAMAVKPNLSLAQARFLIKRFCETIAQIT